MPTEITQLPHRDATPPGPDDGTERVYARSEFGPTTFQSGKPVRTDAMPEGAGDPTVKTSMSKATPATDEEAPAAPGEERSAKSASSEEAETHAETNEQATPRKRTRK